MLDKTLVLETVRKMSEEATGEEILEAIRVSVAIRRGEEDIAAGQVVPHEEVRKKFETWSNRSRSSGPDGPASSSTP